MAWVYASLRCLPGQVAVSWEGRCSVGAPSAPSRSTPTVSACSSRDSLTDHCPTSPSGMTCGPLTGAPGEGSSMLSAAASPAKISLSRAQARALTGIDQGCGQRWRALLGRYDPATRSLRTFQLLLLADSPESLATLPRWGMMRGGECWELAPWELRTEEIGSGLGLTLLTPKVHGNHNAPKAGTKRGAGLSTAVKMLPTPTAQISKNNGSASQMRRNTLPLDAVAGGPLNPLWVEWLMGWPIGWGGLEPLAMDRCRSWLRQHGIY